mgnify:CR=1 FL=1
MTAEDPRITAARKVLADVERTLYYDPDPDFNEWSNNAIAERHGDLYRALADLLAYIDEGAS